jgi:hypothetical protein
MKINEVTQNQPAMQGKVKRASATEVEIEDPKKPGVKTTIDLKKAAVTQDDKGNTVVTPNAQKPAGPNKIGVGATISVNPNEM